VVLGKQQGERLPDALVVVVDASNLDNHLRFALELLSLGLPTVIALNMVDLATRDGLELDAAILSRELGVPVIPTVAVRKRGLDHLRTELDTLFDDSTHLVRASSATSTCCAAKRGASPRRQWYGKRRRAA
jgi:ferrous iron transport protein B